MSVRTSFAPFLAERMARERPIPLAAPVISTFLSSNLVIAQSLPIAGRFVPVGAIRDLVAIEEREKEFVESGRLIKVLPLKGAVSRAVVEELDVDNILGGVHSRVNRRREIEQANLKEVRVRYDEPEVIENQPVKREGDRIAIGADDGAPKSRMELVIRLVELMEVILEAARTELADVRAEIPFFEDRLLSGL